MFLLDCISDPKVIKIYLHTNLLYSEQNRTAHTAKGNVDFANCLYPIGRHVYTTYTVAAAVLMYSGDMPELVPMQLKLNGFAFAMMKGQLTPFVAVYKATEFGFDMSPASYSDCVVSGVYQVLKNANELEATYLPSILDVDATFTDFQDRYYAIKTKANHAL